jgi:type III secretion system YscD/HrpQ family protein
LAQNVIVSLGTTSFIVFNRESERHTIITPFLPSIVKTLQKDDAVKSKKKVLKPASVASSPLEPIAIKELPPLIQKPKRFNRLLLALGLGALLLTFGLATSTLFHSQMITEPEVNTTAEIDRVLANYPGLRYSFNREHGRLLLIGHVLTAIDRSQLLYQLQGLPFIKTVDDGNLIIDEYIVREMNQILSKNPLWTGISLRSPAPGQFILSGYLKGRPQANLIKDFLSQNFRYLDRLDNRVVVEEDELNAINVLIQENGFRDVNLEMNNGEVTLTGTMPADRAAALDQLIQEIKKRPTVRLVKDFVTPLEAEQSVIDLTDSYHISGSSNVGGLNTSIVINGRILGRGDLLDGMVIREIQNNTILLERDGVKYKIDYNK